jgi:hypothetical protein
VQRFLSDSDWRVRSATCWAFLPTPTDVQTHHNILFAALNDRDARVTHAALNYLARHPEELNIALDRVRELTNNVYCRTQALCTLRAAGLIPKGVVNERMVPSPNRDPWKPAK